MKLCYSKATFVYPYERANLESFLDGHVRAFEYFGGVPRRIAYDNLKCAVIRVGKGKDRRLTKRFKELRAFSEEAVLTVLRNEPLPQRAKLDLSDRPELSNQNNGSRDTRIYDQLKDREGVLV